MAVLSAPSNTPTIDGAVIGCTTDDTSGTAYAMVRTDRQWYSVANGDSQALADADKATIIAQDITAPELVWAGTDADLATIQLTIDGLAARLDPANPYYVGWAQEDPVEYLHDFTTDGLGALHFGRPDDKKNIPTANGVTLPQVNTNVFIQSEQPSIPMDEVRSTMADSAATSPRTDMTASVFTEDTTASNTHYASLNAITDTSVDGSVALRFWIKASTTGVARRLRVLLFDGTVGVGAGARGTFDPNTGSLYYTGTEWGETATQTDVGNGWYECTLVGKNPSTGSATGITFSLDDYNTGNPLSQPNYSGDGVSGVQMWGVDLKFQDYVSSYLKTTGTAVTNTNYAVSAPRSVLGLPPSLNNQCGQAKFTLSGDYDDLPDNATFLRYSGEYGSYTYGIVIQTTTNPGEAQFTIRLGTSADGYLKATGLTGLGEGDELDFRWRKDTNGHSLWANGVKTNSTGASGDYIFPPSFLGIGATYPSASTAAMPVTITFLRLVDGTLPDNVIEAWA